MAVFWLVLDGAKGQIRMISVLSTPARVRWVNQYLAASQSGSLRACSAVSQLDSPEAHSRRRDDPPQTNKEASHTSLKSPRRLRDEKREAGGHSQKRRRCARHMGCLSAASA